MSRDCETQRGTFRRSNHVGRPMNILLTKFKNTRKSEEI